MSRIVILSQVYVPDPASVGQHLHDLATGLKARGHDVRVYCSSRGYDDPTRRYPLTETRDGVTIKRYRLPFFSKTNLLVRVLGSAWAMAALFFKTLLTPKLGLVIFSTSPPLVGFVATIACKLRQVKKVYWAMDLNPDQLVAIGKTTETTAVFKLLEAVNRFIVKNADVTIALDRFMDARLRLGKRRPKRVEVIPPWPHEDVQTPLTHDENPFRNRHGLEGKFVVMYSGNHSPANPLDTLLEAILRFKGDDSIRFAFIGGGTGKAQVNAFIEKHQLKNCLSLPYQPLADLRYSLSAGDVHVVSIGQEMVGIIHPCKVYGSMAVARPVLFFGPRPSHVSDLIDTAQIGRQISHGDVDAAETALRELKATPTSELQTMGLRAQTLLADQLSRDILCGKTCDAIESVVR